MGYDSEMGMFCNTCLVSTGEIWQSEVTLEEIATAASALVHTEVIVCQICKKERPKNPKQYDPINLMAGLDPGWYSAYDGEMCGPCMLEIYRKANQL